MRYLVAALLLLMAMPAHAVDTGNNSVCFVPGPEDCAMVAVAEIGKAQRTLDVEQFQLTEPRVSQASIDAKYRGVAVRLGVDKKAPGEKNGQTPAMEAAGIPVWVDARPHIAHNKVIIVDQNVVIGGSFNMTINASRFNAENLLVMRDSAMADAYEHNFSGRLDLSSDLTNYENHHKK